MTLPSMVTGAPLNKFGSLCLNIEYGLRILPVFQIGGFILNSILGTVTLYLMPSNIVMVYMLLWFI